MPPEKVTLLLDGPPDQGGRFVEIEDKHGHGICAGEWIELSDGTWELALFPDAGVTSNYTLIFDGPPGPTSGKLLMLRRHAGAPSLHPEWRQNGRRWETELLIRA